MYRQTSIRKISSRHGLRSVFSPPMETQSNLPESTENKTLSIPHLWPPRSDTSSPRSVIRDRMPTDRTTTASAEYGPTTATPRGWRRTICSQPKSAVSCRTIFFFVALPVQVVLFYYFAEPPSPWFIRQCRRRIVARKWKTKINKKNRPHVDGRIYFTVKSTSVRTRLVTTTTTCRPWKRIAFGSAPAERIIAVPRAYCPPKSRSTFYNIDEFQVSVQLCNCSVSHETVSEKTPLQHAR